MCKHEPNFWGTDARGFIPDSCVDVFSMVCPASCREIAKHTVSDVVLQRGDEQVISQLGTNPEH